jgi:hypothetical protein
MLTETEGLSQGEAGTAQRPTFTGAEKAPHPSEADLERFLRGELPRETARAVVRHLLTNCPLCKVITRRLSPPGDPLLELEALLKELVDGGEPLYDEPTF